MLSNDPLERLRVAWYFLLFMFSAGEFSALHGFNLIP